MQRRAEIFFDLAVLIALTARCRLLYYVDARHRQSVLHRQSHRSASRAGHWKASIRGYREGEISFVTQAASGVSDTQHCLPVSRIPLWMPLQI